MKTYTFYKEETGRWYVDLPDYLSGGGDKADLEMVAGADVFLDILAQGDYRVQLLLSPTPFVGAEKLHLHYTDKDAPEMGATYHLFDYQDIEMNLQLWLCSVTLFVFGEYPAIIYFKRSA